ncbi:hypothetical protein A2210_01740 [Candidatus Woesebacteria bacterium RIFOXYA1_FULL_40_18]|uniref:Glycosyl transferase group 1 n=2 Tax=Candidatus Woeseibacteriota TaxID=1752722 RepID=A0A0G0SL93_9BACT|nr:MAG: Glycosyl transferase group 1 [Candidatus Woesebacteria bacterium GW2011_GWA1_40_45]OGM76265.1 MAG: hypothetical protein A2210_01740 [Candidatus Woesebacteria bacterium RIFOXYA1_FULL_40_18]
MNILILSWRSLGHPSAGGAETATYEHAKAWVEAGHKVTLFTSFYKGARRKEAIGGVRVIRTGADVFGIQIAAFFWYLLGEHPKFDLVVDEFHGIPFFTPLYVRVKKLGWIHEVAKEVWWFNPWPEPFNIIPAVIGTIFERFIFMILYRSTPFMTVSDSTKRELVIWGIPKKNITVIHNGVNLIKVKVKKERKKTAIFLGALTRDKGIEDALKVFSLINQSDTNWRFWIVGKGERDYVNNLKFKIKNLKLDKKVKFWGYVDEKKKFELLTRAHVLVNPSVREGWGLVNVEANSVGTPVVGYKVAGLVDSVRNGETGILVKYGDIQSFASGVIKLSKDSLLYSRFQRNCRQWSGKFKWEKATKKSLKLIESVV